MMTTRNLKIGVVVLCCILSYIIGRTQNAIDSVQLHQCEKIIDIYMDYESSVDNMILEIDDDVDVLFSNDKLDRYYKQKQKISEFWNDQSNEELTLYFNH